LNGTVVPFTEAFRSGSVTSQTTSPPSEHPRLGFSAPSKRYMQPW